MSGVNEADRISRRRFIAGAGAAAAGLALSAHWGSTADRLARPAPSNCRQISNPPQPRLLARAMAALDTHADRIPNRDLIAVVDFAEPSRVPRLHLINVGSGKVTTHLVAHGKGSDPDHSGWVQRLSNQPDSNASSRGAFVTAEAYLGKHGLCRRLEGLDPENSLAESRGIVVHAAS